MDKNRNDRGRPLRRPWRNVLKTFATALLLLVQFGSGASAQWNTTGEEIKIHCREALLATDKGNVSISGFGGGLCIGMLSTAMTFAAFMVPQHMRVCLPKDATPNKANIIFLKFLDDHPERIKEPSLILAIESFRTSWRCPGQIRPLPKSN